MASTLRAGQGTMRDGKTSVEPRLRHAAATYPHPRILMFCGAQHLYAFPRKPLSFVDRLRRKYVTSFVDLRKEPWWDESWIPGWVDPDPLPPLRTPNLLCLTWCRSSELCITASIPQLREKAPPAGRKQESISSDQSRLTSSERPNSRNATLISSTFCEQALYLFS